MPVHWCGFSSDVVTLSQHGWQFIVQHDLATMCVRVGMRHGKLQICTMFDDIYMREVGWYDQVKLISDRPPVRDIVQESLHVMHHAWQGADMEAGFLHARHLHIGEVQRVSLREHFDRIFPPVGEQEPAAQEILVPDEKSVEELLSVILDKQKPVQAELREKHRHWEASVRAKPAATQTHAKIVTLFPGAA